MANNAFPTRPLKKPRLHKESQVSFNLLQFSPTRPSLGRAQPGFRNTCLGGSTRAYTRPQPFASFQLIADLVAPDYPQLCVHQ